MEKKTRRGHKVMRAQVNQADRSGLFSSLFTSKVLSIAEKVFEKEKIPKIRIKNVFTLNEDIENIVNLILNNVYESLISCRLYKIHFVSAFHITLYTQGKIYLSE